MIVAVALGGPAAAVATGSAVRYAGTTSLGAINGFKDPVSFTLGPGMTVRSFSFGTFGCLGGSGGFLQGKSPWSGSSIKSIGALKVSGDGSFSGHATSTRATKVPVYRKTISYGVRARFKRGASTVAGTITLSEKIDEPAVHRRALCGPVTMTFQAVPLA